jgi:hypothetical protein
MKDAQTYQGFFALPPATYFMACPVCRALMKFRGGVCIEFCFAK